MDDEAGAVRVAMVGRLKATGAVVTPAVEHALLAVPRHRFVPAGDQAAAYADRAVNVRYADDGSVISSISQPTMVALMLEQLQVARGDRVLEVGTGTGYNAALLADLVGGAGSVVTVELDPELAATAARTLAELGVPGVEVVAGDGRLGYPPRAPYARVIVTAGASEIAAAWPDQLAAGGRLVVPLVDRRGAGFVVAFTKVDGELRRGAEIGCRFLPIRDPPGP